MKEEKHLYEEIIFLKEISCLFHLNVWCNPAATAIEIIKIIDFIEFLHLLNGGIERLYPNVRV